MASRGVFVFSCFYLIAASFAADPPTNNTEVTIQVLAPPSCSNKPAECKLFLEVKKVTNGFLFKLEAEDTAYVSVGLAENAMMSTASVIDCVHLNGTMQFFQSKTGGPPRDYKRKYTRLELQNSQLLRNTSGSVNDKRIKCEFVRTPVSTVDGMEYDLEKSRFFLQVVSGDKLRENSTIIGKHSKWATSLRPVSLVQSEGPITVVTDVQSGASQLSIQAYLLVLSTVAVLKSIL